MEIMNIKPTEIEISARNKFVAKVSDFYAQQKPVTEMIMLVARALPDGVTLSSLSITENTVHLAGFSPDRNSLVTFKSNLERIRRSKTLFFRRRTGLWPKTFLFP